VQQLLQWKSNKCYIFRVCVCGLSYPACNAHAPYCHLWPVRLHNIFLLYLKNGTIFEKKKEHKMCVLIFSIALVWKISHSKKTWERYDQKSILVFMWSAHYSCQFLMQLKFSWQIFENCSNVTFHENLSMGSWVVWWGQTDRDDEKHNVDRRRNKFYNPWSTH
jgi:hypothetical protein